MKLLLHACCGPCSLEPLRLLLEDGHDITIAYMNSNIHPRSEYTHRLETLLDYARSIDIPVIEGVYDPKEWGRKVGVMGTDMETRPERCRLCYRLRLQEAARYAKDHGFEGLATTLTVSPYQYTETIHEELQKAADEVGIQAVFQDYREQYPEATRRSRALGMYRQNYCGCVFSDQEAAQEREEHRLEREAKRAAREKEMAPIRAAQEAERKKNRAEKQAYANKRAAQRAALKEYKRTHEN